MRKNKIKQAVRAVRKELKNNIDVINVINYLRKHGYKIVLFNTPEGDIEIERYDLQTEKETLPAFVYTETANIVFIDGSLHADDRLYFSLHELGHIVLGHIGDGNLIYRNSVLIDIEADAFAYELIRKM